MPAEALASLEQEGIQRCRGRQGARLLGVAERLGPEPGLRRRQPGPRRPLPLPVRRQGLQPWIGALRQLQGQRARRFALPGRPRPLALARGSSGCGDRVEPPPGRGAAMPQHAPGLQPQLPAEGQTVAAPGNRGERGGLAQPELDPLPCRWGGRAAGPLVPFGCGRGGCGRSGTIACQRGAGAGPAFAVEALVRLHPPVPLRRGRRCRTSETHPGGRCIAAHQGGDAAGSEALAQAAHRHAAAQRRHGGEGFQARQQQKQRQGRRQGRRHHLQAAPQQQGPAQPRAALQRQQTRQGHEHRQQLQQARAQLRLQGPEQAGADQLQQRHQPPLLRATRLQQLQGGQQGEAHRQPAEQQRRLQGGQSGRQQGQRQPLQAPHRAGQPLPDHRVSSRLAGARASSSRQRSRCSRPRPAAILRRPTATP